MVWVLLSASVERVSVSRICIQDIWTKIYTIKLLIFLNLDIHQVSNKLWSPVLTQYYGSTLHTSYIRKEKYCPATTPAVAAAASPLYVTLRGPPLDSLDFSKFIFDNSDFLDFFHFF